MGALSLTACPSMTSREQAAGAESGPKTRHCTKILTGRQGGVAGGQGPHLRDTSFYIVTLMCAIDEAEIWHR